MELDTMNLIARNQQAELMAADPTCAPIPVEPVYPSFDMGIFEEKRSFRNAEPDEPDIQSILLERYREEDKKRKIGGI